MTIYVILTNNYLTSIPTFLNDIALYKKHIKQL